MSVQTIKIDQSGRGPEATTETGAVIRAITSRLSQPAESTDLTDEELAFFEQEVDALNATGVSIELCEQLAKYANLGDPAETQAFLRDFSTWIEQKKTERIREDHGE